MFISRLFVKNYRNLRSLDITIQPGVTCFIGENNSGKTNLFQALRLVLDGNISAQRRRLQPEDLSAGLSFTTPEHVLISVELSDFAGKENEEAFPFTAIMENGNARISYRFRPKPTVRNMIEEIPQGQSVPALKLDDYVWEMVGGGDDVDLDKLTWDASFGSRFSTDDLQEGYLVVMMDALRDVESRLAVSRTSPLQQILEQRNISDEEQVNLVQQLRTANENINASETIREIGTQLTNSFRDSAGRSFSMEVSLGLGEPSFADISRGLRVLLSGYGLQTLDPSRNGLGLNNILFISMLLSYFERRMAEKKTAGELLLVEEPEAHLHPQLQRVLLATLQRKSVQVFITTHSTHVTSGLPLSSQIVLTSDGGPITQCAKPSAIPDLSPEDAADLERYLDATRSVLLYARKVLLVEGPAEQFIIAPLAKAVLGIDLDEHGIAVVPIFGTHFSSYAKLFGPGGMRKKCAILTDGDLTPSDADPSVEAEEGEGERSPRLADLEALRGQYVEIFSSETTFERELTLPGTLGALAAAVTEVGVPTAIARIQHARARIAAGQAADLDRTRESVLRAAKRFGKARFAQVVSKYISGATEMPDYIADALNWLLENDSN